MHGSFEFRFGLPRKHEKSSNEKRRTLRRGAAMGAIFVLASLYENNHSGPAMVATPRSISFGATSVGSSSTIQNVRIRNEGRSGLEVLGLEMAGPDAAEFAFQNASCSARKLEPGDDCEVAVKLRPATIGSFSAELDIRSSDSSNPHVVSLTGKSTGQGHLVIIPLDLAFDARVTGGEAPAQEQELTLQNAGTASLKVSRISVTGSAALDFVLDSNCEGKNLERGEACSVPVKFQPQNAGVRQATVNVEDTAGDGVHSASVTGEGLARIAAGSWQPDHLEISTHTGVDGRAVRSSELKSDGTIPLELSKAKIVGEDAGLFQISSDSCSGGTITTNTTNRTCNLSVAFVPHEAGKWDAAVVYEANTPSGEVRLPLTGYAVTPKVATPKGPQIRIDPPNLDFEQLQPNQEPPQQEVVISNPDGDTLMIRSLRIVGSSSFSLTSTGKCEGMKLEGARSCKLRVAYTTSPAASTVLALFKQPPARDSGALLIEDNAPGSPHRVNLQGTRNQARSLLSVRPNPRDFGNIAIGAKSDPLVAVLTSAGGSAARILRVWTTGDFAVTADECTNRIIGQGGQGQQCQVRVEFRPTAVGARTGKLTFSIADGMPPVEGELRGTGYGRNPLPNPKATWVSPRVQGPG